MHVSNRRNNSRNQFVPQFEHDLRAELRS
jgi:hypothetical protein